MKLAFLLLAFVVSSEAMSGRNMKQIQDSLKEIMEFKTSAGCLDVRWLRAERIATSCYVMIVMGVNITKPVMKEDKMKMDEHMEKHGLSDPKAFILNHVDCMLEETDSVNEDGTLNWDAVGKAMDGPVGDEEDVATAKELGEICYEETDRSLPANQQFLRFNQCYVRSILKHCDKKNAPVGPVYPLINAIYSLTNDNDNCKAVKIPEKFSTKECLQQDEVTPNDSVDKMFTIAMDFASKVRAAMGKLMKLFKEIPEIKCIRTTGEANGLIDGRGKPDAQAIAKALMSFDGWKNQKDAETISNRLVECMDKSADVKGPMRMVKSVSCFLPTFTQTCGFNNKLSWEFLHPFTSYELWGRIKKRIHESYESSEVKNLVESMMGDMD